MRRQVDVAIMTISRSERRSDPQSILLRGQKRDVFGLSATYPLIEVLLKINRSNWHPLLEKNRPKAKAKDTVSSFPKTGKQHLTLRPATHLPRSNHRLLWAAIIHTFHSGDQLLVLRGFTPSRKSAHTKWPFCLPSWSPTPNNTPLPNLDVVVGRVAQWIRPIRRF